MCTPENKPQSRETITSDNFTAMAAALFNTSQKNHHKIIFQECRRVSVTCLAGGRRTSVGRHDRRRMVKCWCLSRPWRPRTRLFTSPLTTIWPGTSSGPASATISLSLTSTATGGWMFDVYVCDHLSVCMRVCMLSQKRAFLYLFFIWTEATWR